MEARRSDTEQEKPAGPVGQPLEPQFRESPLAEDKKETPKKKRAWMLIPVVILAIVGVVAFVRYLAYSRSHVSTDNAFLAANITLVAPQSSGTVQKILVEDNQPVKAGQLLVVLDDSTYRANLAEAQANLSAAIAAQQAAEADLALSRKTSGGQLTQAQGGVTQAQSGIAQAQAGLTNAVAAVSVARAQQGNAVSNVESSDAALRSAIQSRARAVQAVESARSQVVGADAGVRAAQANVKSAQAHQAYAAAQAKRLQTLLSEGAISAQQAESAQQDLETANAALQATQDQVATAQANLESRRSDLKVAQQNVPIADAAISQARAIASGARHQQDVAAGNVREAQANQQSMTNAIEAARGKATQAVGQQQSADTVSQVVASKQAAAQQAAARVAQARAALQQAQLDLQHTKVYAPLDGVVGNRTIDQGSLVQAGTPMMSVVQEGSLYVNANLKETQIAALREGQEAEIDVDGFPTHPFHGHLLSLSPATGATFALLPPDNASGNFVKVVQRVPVRVGLDANQADIDKLRAGMSATVSIRTK